MTVTLSSFDNLKLFFFCHETTAENEISQILLRRKTRTANNYGDFAFTIKGVRYDLNDGFSWNPTFYNFRD